MASGGLSGAASLIILAAALNILVPVLMQFSNMSLEQIGTSLLMLAGTFTVLGVAAAILSPLSPVLLALGAAVALLGVGCLSAGGGVMLLATGLAALSSAFANNSSTIMTAITSLISLIPTLATSLGEGVIAMATAIGNGSSAILMAVTQILTALLQSIINISPKLAETFVAVINSLLQAITKTAPNFVEAGVTIISSMLDGVKKLSDKASNTVISVLEDILNAIVDCVPMMVESGFQIITGFLQGIADNIGGVVEAGVSIVVNFLNSVGEQLPLIVDAGFNLIINFINGLTNSISANGPILAASIQNLMTTVITTSISILLGSVGRFLSAGISIFTGFISGIKSKFSEVYSSISTMISQMISNIQSNVSGFVSAGGDLINGFINGIKSKISEAAEWAANLAKSALDAAKNALGIQSPSRAFMAIGRYIGEGLAIGIQDSAYMAVNATEESASKIQNAASKAFEEVEKWVQDAKAFDELSLEDELILWDTVAQKYAEGTEEKTKADKNAYEAYKALLQDKFQNSKDWIDREKEYNRLSLEEELAAWQRIQNTYIEGTDEREEADKQVYKLRHELIDNSINLIDQEIARQQQLLSELQEGSIEYANTIKEIQYLKTLRSSADFANSENWIQQQEDFDKFNIASELAAYLRVANKARNGFYGAQSDEILKEYEKKVYDSQKEIYDRYKQYLKDCGEVQEEANEQRLELQQEYYDKEKEINDKLLEDIEELDNEYKDSVKSRADELYSAYSLFDSIEKKEEVSGSELMKNLQDQVAEFDEWRDAMDQLSARGLNDDLIDELQDMGPSAIAEIKALNSMSDSQLEQYATLWATRHQEATDRAEEELIGLKESTNIQIEELRLQASEQLDEYKDTWNKKMRELDSSVAQQLEDLRIEFGEEVGLIQSDTEAKTQEMITTVQRIMLEAGWSSIGEQIVNGLTEGVMIAAPSFIDALSGTVISGQGAITHGWDINSPSKVASKFGRNIIEGLIVGIKNTEKQFYNSLGTVATQSINSMSDTISCISDVISSGMNFEPAIRPIIDMSNLNRSVGYMDNVIESRRSILLGMSISGQNQNREYSMIDKLVSNLNNSNKVSNNKIVDAIVGLKSDFDNLASRIESLQIVMDTGSLVGAISPEMDRSLGKIATMNRRRSR